MKKLLLAIVLIVGCEQHPLDKIPSEEVFRYKLISPPDDILIEELNLLGKEGWEVVTQRRVKNENDIYVLELLLKQKWYMFRVENIISRYDDINMGFPRSYDIHGKELNK